MTNDIKQRIEQINRGEVPQGYKKTEVGIVPNEWEETQLSEIFKFKNGLNKEKEAFGKGTPIVNYVDVWKKRGIKAKTVEGRVTLSQKEIENYSVKKGDVFFTRTSETKDEIGLSSVMLDDIENAVFSGFVLRARPFNKKIFTPYNQYCYSSDLMRYEVIRKSSITTRALTSGPSLGQVQINLPSFREQQRIADILSRWDEAIELQEKLIAKLEEQKKALMQKLLTPNEGWKVIKIADLFVVTRGQVLPVSECKNEYTYPVYSSQTLNNGLMGYYKVYLFEDSITWTTDGANAGKVVFRKGKFYCTNVCGVLINRNGYCNSCLAYLLDLVTPNYVSYVGNPKLMNNTMESIKLNIPPLSYQLKVSKIIDLSDGKLSLEYQKLQKLKQQHKALQQLLLTGIVRV